MARMSATFRITLGLVCLTLSVVLAASTLGLVPDRKRPIIEKRAALAETIAIDCSLFAERRDIQMMRASLEAVVERNAEILSVGVRRPDGKLLAEAGEHQTRWNDAEAEDSSATHVIVPITLGSKPWGTVEVTFAPVERKGLLSFLGHPVIELLVFVAVACLLLYFVYLRKMLQHLDPSKVVPERVRKALDSLGGGLLVLDKNERIVLANQAFAKSVGRSTDELLGQRASELPWVQKEEQATGDAFPWVRAIRDGAAQEGIVLGMKSAVSSHKIFMVNTSPIRNDKGEERGVLASFEDVTLLEQRNAELREMLESLRQSRDEIRRQNEELEKLATRDPLTGCLNRRAFFTEFEVHWDACRRYKHPLSCIMLDIDQFKSINDTHGHAAGDQVLQQMGQLLDSTRRDCDLVCRYGGEEFCVLLPYTDLTSATLAAERLRVAIQSRQLGNLPITASLGVSALTLGAGNPQELMQQADKALYLAKHMGRNRAVRWDEVATHGEFDPSQAIATTPIPEMDASVAIPFHAVTALISALAYRDARTAEHARRVADLCVATASGLMPLGECYVLEIAALLHDIGKIGVPDHILLKPGPLTPDEWQVMHAHDRIGVEIIRASFASDALTAIVEKHHAWYGGTEREPGLPSGKAIPLGARILTIADAYDAIVSDRVYRKGRSQDAAFAELRRCAGAQFDPELVERFIATVSARNASDHTSAPPSVSKQTALRIGLQIERLACALDDQNFASLRTMAGRLKSTAAKDGIAQIAEQAAKLEESISSEPDLMKIVQLTTDLLDMCRSTQSTYVSNLPNREGESAEPALAGAAS